MYSVVSVGHCESAQLPAYQVKLPVFFTCRSSFAAEAVWRTLFVCPINYVSVNKMSEESFGVVMNARYFSSFDLLTQKIKVKTVIFL